MHLFGFLIMETKDVVEAYAYCFDLRVVVEDEPDFCVDPFHAFAVSPEVVAAGYHGVVYAGHDMRIAEKHECCFGICKLETAFGFNHYYSDSYICDKESRGGKEQCLYDKSAHNGGLELEVDEFFLFAGAEEYAKEYGEVYTPAEGLVAHACEVKAEVAAAHAVFCNHEYKHHQNSRSED